MSLGRSPVGVEQMRQRGGQAGFTATLWWLTGIGGTVCSSEVWTGDSVKLFFSLSVRLALRTDGLGL